MTNGVHRNKTQNCNSFVGKTTAIRQNRPIKNEKRIAYKTKQKRVRMTRNKRELILKHENQFAVVYFVIF